MAEIPREQVVKLRLELEPPEPDLFVRWLRQAIKIRSATPSGLTGEEKPSWVLVKGYHDSGTLDGVFGPYTEAHIDWLLGSVLDCSSYNWTKVKLSSGPEESSDGTHA